MKKNFSQTDMNLQYVYVYLDNRKPGKWEFEGICFDYQPFYVGIGKWDRMNEHLQSKKLSKINIKNNIIKKIIRETGQEPIRYKIFENVTNSDARNIEIKFIAQFGRIDIKSGILSNLTDGGEGAINLSDSSREKLSKSKTGKKNPASKVVNQYNLDGSFVAEWDSFSEAAQSLGIKNCALISFVANKENRTAYGYRWRSEGKSKFIPNPPPPTIKTGITTFYYKNGIFKKEYPSFKSCADDLNFSLGVVKYYLNLNQTTQDGSQWFTKFQGDQINFQPFEPISERYKIKFFQYDLDGYFIAEHSGINQVSKDLNISNIGKALSSGRLAGGFQWKREYMGNKIEAVEIAPIKQKIYKAPYTPLTVHQLDPNTKELIKTWPSIRCAAESLNLLDSGIQRSCSNNYKTSNGDNLKCGGFYWRYEVRPKPTSS